MKYPSLKAAIKSGVENYSRRVQTSEPTGDIELFIEPPVMEFLSDVILDFENKILTREELVNLWKRVRSAQ